MKPNVEPEPSGDIETSRAVTKSLAQLARATGATLARLVALAVLLAGCSGLRPEDVTGIKGAVATDVLLYQREGARTANGALARSVACELVAVLQRNRETPPPTPGIVCAPPPK